MDSVEINMENLWVSDEYDVPTREAAVTQVIRFLSRSWWQKYVLIMTPRDTHKGFDWDFPPLLEDDPVLNNNALSLREVFQKQNGNF